jgi:hypothetical protein
LKLKFVALETELGIKHGRKGGKDKRGKGKKP